jgi:hypothetical protein
MTAIAEWAADAPHVVRAMWPRLGLAHPSPFGTHTITHIHSVLDA